MLMIIRLRNVNPLLPSFSSGSGKDHGGCLSRLLCGFFFLSQTSVHGTPMFFFFFLNGWNSPIVQYGIVFIVVKRFCGFFLV
uniref:Uncharacterized protein n=1 Tax=Salix viminalis TaxID=40686 RepID=A0A6N2LNZ3_SALVM